jgi:hypothetical protein
LLHRSDQPDSLDEAEAAVGIVDKHFAIIAVSAIFAKAILGDFRKALQAQCRT